jgi:hypothetical protein
MNSHHPHGRNHSELLCGEGMFEIDNNTDSCSHGNGGTSGDEVKWVTPYLVICMILLGIGQAPRNPLAITYIESNAEKSKVGIFIGKCVYGILHFDVV